MKLAKTTAFALLLLIIVALIISIDHFQNRKLPVSTQLFFKDFSEKNCSEMLFIERSDTSRLKRKGAEWKLLTKCIPAVPAETKLGEKTSQTWFND